MTRAFYFDVGSPYVYLTVARLPLDDVEWKPISLGGLWKQSGGGSWALTDRRAEGIAEIEARAERDGLPPICWPAPWPGRYLSAMPFAILYLPSSILCALVPTLAPWRSASCGAITVTIR